MTYEMIAGYLRGFGISMVPAVLTMLGVCGVRIVWVYTAFAANRTFDTLLLAYPLSLAVTAALLLGALQNAKQKGLSLTDDCAAVEALGMTVLLTDGSEENIKITTPLDLDIAELILKRRQTP